MTSHLEGHFEVATRLHVMTSRCYAASILVVRRRNRVAIIPILEVRRRSRVAIIPILEVRRRNRVAVLRVNWLIRNGFDSLLF
jgi:hypothetical protein